MSKNFSNSGRKSHYSCDVINELIDEVWEWIKDYIDKKPNDISQLRAFADKARKDVAQSIVLGCIQHHINKIPLMLEKAGIYMNYRVWRKRTPD